MRANLFKSYLKYRYKSLLIGIVVLVLIDWADWGDLPGNLILLFLFATREFYHFPEKLERLKKLKAKGLTEKDLLNIEFVKKWEETRTGGIWKYCLMYGMLIGGFGYSLALTLCFAIADTAKFKGTLSEPGDMFHLMGMCYIIGALLGVVSFRVFWFLNERRFNRLTDPINTIFSSKRTSFNNPL